MNIPKGYKLVPVEPTDDMVIAFAETWYSKRHAYDDPDMDDAYRDMLAAAPTPPQPIYDEAKERELFEAFVVNFHHGAKLTGYVHDDPDYPGLNGQFLYEDWDVQSAWAVWQKCAQSRAKSVEVGDE